MALLPRGGAGAWALGLPLALLIGPMVTLTVVSQRWHQLRVSKPVCGVALVIIGLTPGQYLALEIIATWRNITGARMLNAVMSVVGTADGCVLIRHLLAYDPAVAISSALPGEIPTVMEVSRESEAAVAGWVPDTGNR